MKKSLILTFIIATQLNCFAITNTPESNIKPIHSLINNLKEIVNTLEQENPQIIEKFSEQDKQFIIETFINSLGARITLIPNNTLTKENISKKIYKPFHITKNNYLYVRIDSLIDKSIRTTINELNKYIQEKGSNKGCIIDLRNCSGFETTGATKLLNTLNKIKLNNEAQLYILVGQNTSGSAEIVARIIENKKIGFILGSDTAGTPVPQRYLPLNSGGYLKIPIHNDYLNAIDIKPVHPNLFIDNNKQTSYNELYTTMRGEKKDECLSRAIDLMISINATQ